MILCEKQKKKTKRKKKKKSNGIRWFINATLSISLSVSLFQWARAALEKSDEAREGTVGCLVRWFIAERERANQKKKQEREIPLLLLPDNNISSAKQREPEPEPEPEPGDGDGERFCAF